MADSSSFRSILDRFQGWVFSREPVASRMLGRLRSVLRVLCIMVREFDRTHISLRAAALTYGLALALVPTLALSTAIMKGVGSDVRLKEALFQVVDQLDPQPSRTSPPTPVRDPGEPSGAEPAASQEAGTVSYLHRGLDLVFEYVENTNFAALGLIGVLGLLAVFVMLLSAFEEAMNAIWHTSQRRPLLRRFMDYLALVIVLPLSLNIAVAADAILASEQLTAQLQQLMPSTWVLALVVKLSTFCCIVLSLMGMYIFFPNDKVRTGAALVGAIFAAFFWFLFQRLYIVLQVGVSKYNAIYGSFATIPLLLVALNLGILFILLGASLTYAIQYRDSYSSLSRGLSPQRQLQLAFDILAIVYHNFSRRIPNTMQLLQESLPGSRPLAIETTVDRLISGRILQRASDEGEVLMPATSAEQLTGSEVLALVLGDDRLDTPGGLLADRALHAAAQTLQESLVSAIDHIEQEGAAARGASIPR